MKEGKKKGGGGDCHVMLLQCMFKYTNKYTLEPLLICELFCCTTPNNKYYKYMKEKMRKGLIFYNQKYGHFFTTSYAYTIAPMVQIT